MANSKTVWSFYRKTKRGKCVKMAIYATATEASEAERLRKDLLDTGSDFVVLLNNVELDNTQSIQ